MPGKCPSPVYRRLGDQFALDFIQQFRRIEILDAENVFFHDMLSSTALVKRTLTVMVNRFNRAVSDEPEPKPSSKYNR